MMANRFRFNLLNLLLLLAFAPPGQGGQSINLQNRYVGNASVPSQPRNNPWRVEMFVHDWDDATFGLASLPALGAQIRVFTSGNQVILEPSAFLWHSAESSGCQFRLDQLQDRAFYLRLQRDPATRRVLCEVWDVNGARFGNHTVSFTDGGTFQQNGVFLGSASPTGANRLVGFLRIHNSLLPLNSRPPVFRDDADRLLEWKFDGNTNSSAGSWNPSALAGGSLSYLTTPGQNRPVSRIKTKDAPFWSDWVSLRAGYPASLDGRASYALADTSANVTYDWRQVSGPTELIWNDRQSATPQVEGLVFGSYRVRLTVTDDAGNQAVSETDIGAVATDANGVVIHGDDNVEKIFGPMIAFGRNPWGLADDSHLRGARIRGAQYNTVYAPEWTTPLPGTIDYVATSDPTQAPQQRLAAALTATAATIPLDGVANLNFAGFPTVVSIDLPGYGGEEVLVCGVDGNTLQVCYDGRGYGFSNARSWNANTRVFHRRVAGNGTSFLASLCPAGPGLSGPITYSAGAVSVTPGSSTLTGANTSWTGGNGVFGGQAIRIAGTHGGGQPFVFFASINSISNGGQLTMSRPWPADADPGSGLSYRFFQFSQVQLAPKWTRPDGTEGQTLFGITACLDDSNLFLRFGLEAVRGVQTGKQYSLMRQFWMSQGGNGTPNFYDEVLANYALYFRSGWEPARAAARLLGDEWVKQPLLDEGWGSGPGIPRNIALAGVMAATMLDGRTDNWYAIRRLAEVGASKVATSCDDDLRESAYQMMWLAFAAIFDPVDTGNPNEPGQRSYWKAKLAQNYNRDFSCRGPDNSFPSGLYFNPFQFPALTVTHGETGVLGTDLPASICPTIQSGQGAATAGSATLRVTGANLLPRATGQQILILTGTRDGQPFTLPSEWSGSGATVTLAARWIGDSGPVTWLLQNDENVSIIATGPSDPTFGAIYGCTYHSPTLITLNRPYAGATGTARLYRANIAGRGVQPFMLGIKALQMLYAAQGANQPVASNYRELAAAAARWVLETGFDPSTGGLYYARGFPHCEPVLEASQPGFRWRNTGCSHGIGKDDRDAARALLAEAQSAARAAYEFAPSQQLLELGDQFYSNQWGVEAFTRAGFGRTDSLENIYASDGALGFGKWYGFQFGVGMAHQWPAVRLGGAQPYAARPAKVNFDLAAVDGAASVRLKLTAPSGKVTSVACSASPCAVELDARLGGYWAQVEYLSGSGGVLRTGKPELLRDASPN
jgi:hypothetical protein